MRLNTLYYGDNLQILREHIEDESVDLIYLDPPFNSNANYNVLFRSPAGKKSHAQIEAFEDTWHWTGEAEQAFDQVMQSGNTDAAELLRAMRSFLKENDMMAYLTMMAIRLLQLHRVLKDTGSLYLHCDPTASHYLRLLLDGIFGPDRFLSEIIWKRYGAHSNSKIYGAVHDTILFYSKTNELQFNRQFQPYAPEYIVERFRFTDPDGRRWSEQNLANPDVRPNLTYPFIARNGITYLPPPNGWKYEKKRMQELDDARRLHYPAKADGRLRLKNYFDEMPGVAIQDVWTDLSLIGGTSPERLGYPTQKPLGLMERIINSSSNEGQVVLDPFCGCGTTVHAAQKLKREWIGIDVTSLAIGLIKDRIRRAFPDVEFEIVGMPKDLDGAHALADQDKYQFQWWAVQLIPDAQPYGGKKKGADSGIDGLFYFKPDLKSTEKGIISVKGGGNVSVPMIRDLAHVVKREKAQMGIFITLADPTKPMLTEAVKEGLYETVFGKYPRLQIVTIEQLLRGEIPKMPPADVSSLRRAVREDTAKQNPLF